MKLSENNCVLILLVVTTCVFIAYLIVKKSQKTRKPIISGKKQYSPHFPSYMFNNSIYAPIKGKGFGISVQNLEQPNDFYRRNREDTLKYLSGVYPLATDSLNSLGDLELASFYNSLTYYYNCDFNYQGNTLSSANGKFPVKWDKLPCASEYPMPYPPQGWFFNWSAFNELDVPYTYSDSSGGKELLGQLGSCRPGIAFQGWGPKSRAGPGTLYVNCRAAIRNLYRPRGIVQTSATPPKANGKLEWQPWSRLYVTDNRNMPYNYPWGWQSGVPDNQHIEVAHTQPTPGMVQSMGWWYNAMTGTGMFLNVGRSIRAGSKVEAMFKLLKELKEKDPETIKKHFGGLTDPYMICWYQFAYCGYETNAGFEQNTFCQWKYVNCSQWCVPDSLAAGMLIGNQKPRKFLDDTIDFCKSMGYPLNDNGSPGYEGIKAAIDASIDQSNYVLSRMSVSPLCDEPTFFLASLLDYDSVQFPLDPNGNGYYTFEIMDCRVPTDGKYENIVKEIKNRDYSTFVGNSKTGVNGELGPLPVTVEQGNQSANFNAYYQDFIDQWLKDMKTNRIITIRDPLDINNDTNTQICAGLEIVNGVCPENKKYGGAWYNLTCDAVPLAASYRCLHLGQDAGDSPCTATGSNPTC